MSWCKFHSWIMSIARAKYFSDTSGFVLEFCLCVNSKLRVHIGGKIIYHNIESYNDTFHEIQFNPPPFLNTPVMSTNSICSRGTPNAAPI